MSVAIIAEVVSLNTRGLAQVATGVAAIANTLAPGVPFRLREVRVHLSAAGGAGDLTATVDAELAAPTPAVNVYGPGDPLELAVTAILDVL